MVKQNCWELKNCGRTPGGAKAAELGVCPAAVDSGLHGINGGKNGGRICWSVTGTLCGGKVQGVFALKRLSCMTCDFYVTVRAQEASGFTLLRPGQEP